MGGEFSLYWWDIEGNQHEELRYVSAQESLLRAKTMINSPANLVLGVINRIIITDSMDAVCFEWNHGKGVVFPRQGQQEDGIDAV